MIAYKTALPSYFRSGLHKKDTLIFSVSFAGNLSGHEAISYIIELKYAKYKDSESRGEELRLEGIAQANRYADSDRVKNAVAKAPYIATQNSSGL